MITPQQDAECARVTYLMSSSGLIPNEALQVGSAVVLTFDTMRGYIHTVVVLPNGERL